MEWTCHSLPHEPQLYQHQVEMVFHPRTTLSGSLWNQILEELLGGVAGGHFGEEKTMDQVKAYFHWAGQKSDLMAEVCRVIKFHKMRATPYHPQGDELVEWFNHTLLDMLATMTKEQPGDWMVTSGGLQQQHSGDHWLQSFFPLLFGHEAHLPLDLMYHSDTLEPATHSEYTIRMKRRHTTG